MNPNPPPVSVPIHPAQETGCIVILKTGERMQLDISLTRAKYMRRSGASTKIQGENGQVRMLRGNEIRQILPHYA